MAMPQSNPTNDLPLPSPQQAAWQDMEVIAFAHFGINTFTDREWGEGNEDPRTFNPTALDARQWVRVLKTAGVKLLILTAKHHDGFCLWPSRFTEHCVKNSPWRQGRGDVVREVADACREGGIKLGLYLSPWDRHEKTYGDSPAYNEHFRNQLRELLSGYGEVVEVWFDGACGEGPNGKRQEYDWPGFYRVVRELQPRALIAICGPDIRWVGNEDGLARENETSVQPVGQEPWAAATHQVHPGDAGNVGRTLMWHPAECDVSIRPGWFYHPKEDGQVKSLQQLMDIYCRSVGRNAVLLLNVPPDRRGLIHENDARRLAEFGAEVAKRFGTPLAATQGQGETLDIMLDRPTRVDRVILMEDIRKGERIQGYILEARVGSDWKPLRQGVTIGHKQIIQFPPLETQSLRLRVTQSSAPPLIRHFAVYAADATPASIPIRIPSQR